mgnify:CR=1 FL=1
MNFLKEKISKLNPQQISQMLELIVDDLYQKFDYLIFSKEEFYQEVSKMAMALLEQNREENFDLIKEKLNQKLTKLAEEEMMRRPGVVINRYINKRFHESNILNMALENMYGLTSFLRIYHYPLTSYELIEILACNEKSQEALTVISSEYNPQISMGELDKMLKDNILVDIINTYYLLNDTKIEVNREKNRQAETSYEPEETLVKYLKEIGDIPLLSQEEEQRLMEQILQGNEEARQTFIKSNLRLVISVAKRYPQNGLSLLDLIQEGNIGLIKAVEKYDASKNVKFSSYAVYRIKAAITAAITEKSRSIRIPDHMYAKINTYKKAVSHLRFKLNREPTIEEIATYLEVSPVVVEEFKGFQLIQDGTTSINKLVQEDEREIEDFIPATEESPEEIVVNHDMITKTRALLDTCSLTLIEKEVLISSYGFRGPILSLGELGAQFQMSREGIRQIKERALAKIREEKQIAYFTEYMQDPDQALKNLKELQKKKKKRTQNLKTIYQLMEPYSKEQVDFVLNHLSEEEMKIITLRCGGDLNHPVFSKIKENQVGQLYGYLLPKIKKTLEQEFLSPSSLEIKDGSKQQSMTSKGKRKSLIKKG